MLDKVKNDVFLQEHNITFVCLQENLIGTFKASYYQNKAQPKSK